MRQCDPSGAASYLSGWQLRTISQPVAAGARCSNPPAAPALHSRSRCLPRLLDTPAAAARDTAAPACPPAPAGPPACPPAPAGPPACPPPESAARRPSHHPLGGGGAAGRRWASGGHGVAPAPRAHTSWRWRRPRLRRCGAQQMARRAGVAAAPAGGGAGRSMAASRRGLRVGWDSAHRERRDGWTGDSSRSGGRRQRRRARRHLATARSEINMARGNSA